MNTLAYRLVIFDLDGTLADSRTAITTTIKETLSTFDIKESDEGRLLSFIGPSLTSTYGGTYGLTGQLLAEALELHSKIFKEKGIALTVSFPGIPELMEELKKQGAKLAIATTKSTHDATAIIKKDGIGEFDYIIGAAQDSTTSEKEHLLVDVLAFFPSVLLQDVVMIGDRKYDWEAARRVGIDSIAVTYGFGSPEEVAAGSPTFIAHSVSELSAALLLR